MTDTVPRWEYLAVEIEADTVDPQDARWRGKCTLSLPLHYKGRTLDQLGSNGWEVVGILNQHPTRWRLLLRRPLL